MTGLGSPGHPDFIAEVERVLRLLDAAIVVVSAVEGVRAQTRVLVRVLQRLGIPFLFFVNKMDRAGARYDEVLSDIAREWPSAPCHVDHRQYRQSPSPCRASRR
jgi:ribosomal protection tetracycline resistance protein